MNTTGLKCAAALVALAICSACGGGSAVAPSGSTGMSGLGPIVAIRDIPPSPDAKKHHKAPAEQFISNFGSGSMAIFDYPKSDKQIGTISGVTSAQGECTNVLFGTGKKTFWVTSSVSGASPIDEYQVAKTHKLVRSLQGASGDTLVGCAMSTTGDLAATSITNGHVDIFKGAKGTPTSLTTPLIEAFFDGYDTKGNLYVDGFNSGGTFGFVELPKGKTTWVTLLGPSVEFPGGVQWDGKYVAVGDVDKSVIYQTSGDKVVGTTTLSGADFVNQFWVAPGTKLHPQGTKVVAPSQDGSAGVGIYAYPAGGSPTKTITVMMPR